MTEFRSVWKYLFDTPHALRWIDVDGIRTRFLEAGPAKAPTIIMLHGAAGSLENFCANIPAFAQHFRVLAIDLVGAGWSDKPDHPYTPDVYVDHIQKFMETLGVEQAGFVGHALGSTVTAHLARKAPERIAAMALVTPGGIIADPKAHEEFLVGVKARRGVAAADPSWESIERIFQNLILKAEDRLPEFVALRLQIYQTEEMRRAMPHMFATANAEQCLSHKEWSELQAPTLVFGATDAPNQMLLANARLIASLVPGARLVEIADCALWPQFEQADSFNEASIAFFRDALIKAFRG